MFLRMPRILLIQLWQDLYFGRCETWIQRFVDFYHFVCISLFLLLDFISSIWKGTLLYSCLVGTDDYKGHAVDKWYSASWKTELGTKIGGWQLRTWCFFLLSWLCFILQTRVPQCTLPNSMVLHATIPFWIGLLEKWTVRCAGFQLSTEIVIKYVDHMTNFQVEVMNEDNTSTRMSLSLVS